MSEYNYKNLLFKNNIRSVFISIILVLLIIAGNPSNVIAAGNKKQSTVSGTVTDSKTGETLIGVYVLVKGTGKGMVTNAEGKYTLNIDEGNAVLVFSFLGYKTLEVNAGAQTVVDVKLEEDVLSLDDVIVVGYGTVKKSDITGSVTSVTSESFEAEPVTTFSQAMQGRAAGVAVQNNSGAPGGNVKIRIRGANSIIGDNNPLYVVDGIAISGGINDVNINDIASMEVLKDASATAIYGNRGANGVVMITTKKGKSGNSQIQFDANYGTSNIAKKMDLLNAGEYARLYNVYDSTNMTAADVELYKNKAGTNWQDKIYQMGYTQNYQLSAMGGTEKIRYYFSGNYTDEKGILITSAQKKYAVRSNISSDLTDKLKIDLNIYAARINSKNISERGSNGGAVFASMIWSPTKEPYDTDGKYVTDDPLAAAACWNPIMQLKEINDQKTKDLVSANTKISYKILPVLSFDATFGLENNADLYQKFKSTYINSGKNFAEQGEYKSLYWQQSYVLTYQKNFNAHHDVTLMGGVERSKNQRNGFSASGNDITPQFLGWNRLQDAGNQTIYSNWGQSQLQSYFGRFLYSLYDRYLFTFTFRRDGTSKFLGNNQWGNFPSAAIGWKISEEPFMKNISVINNFKLRTSWGITGNQNVNEYATIATVRTDKVSFGTTSGYPAAYGEGVDNVDLKWETTTQSNIGLDISILQNRISFSADYFYKKTNDLLFSQPIADYVGGGIINRNVGAVENKGFEFTLSGVPVLTNGFKWDIDLTFSAVRTTMLKMSKDTLEGSNFGAALDGNAPEFRLIRGQEMGTFYGYKWLGIYSNSAADSTEAAKYGLKPGQNKYLDTNNDGVVDGTDRVNLSPSSPRFIFGINNTFSYKNWDLNVMISGSYGNKMLNLVYGAINTRITPAVAISHRDGFDYWRPDNQNAKFSDPKLGTANNYLNSSQFIQDASFVKLKNVAIAYKINKEVIGFAGLKFILSAQNLVTITKYKGLDPETTSSDSDKDGAVDLGTYPLARSFTFSIQAKF